MVNDVFYWQIETSEHQPSCIESEIVYTGKPGGGGGGLLPMWTFCRGCGVSFISDK